MFSSPLLSPQRNELSLPATSKALLTSLLISIISTHRSHIRRPFDGTIRRASLEYVLVPTAVSTTQRALSPCDVEGSFDKPVNLDNQHLSPPHYATVRWYDSPCVFRVCSRPHCCLHNATSSLPATSRALLTNLLISIISTYRSHIRRPFDGTIRRLYIGHTFAASE